MGGTVRVADNTTMSRTTAPPPIPPNLPAPLDPDGPYRVLMVCTGNICRSAMAEIVLRSHLAPSAPGDDGAAPPRVVVTSAGVSDEEHGNPMDPRAVRVLHEAGYDADPQLARAIAAHRAHQVTDHEIRATDLLLAMTASHHAALTRCARRLGTDPGRIRMFRELDPDSAGQAVAVEEGRAARGVLDVPDPWYGTTADFYETLEVVERVSRTLTTQLVLASGPA